MTTEETPSLKIVSTLEPSFFVSDATAITAETLANSVLAQFHGLKYSRYRMPFINTVDKAKEAALKINEVGKETGIRPLVFLHWWPENWLQHLTSTAMHLSLNYLDLSLAL